MFFVCDITEEVSILPIHLSDPKSAVKQVCERKFKSTMYTDIGLVVKVLDVKLESRAGVVHREFPAAIVCLARIKLLTQKNVEGEVAIVRRSALNSKIDGCMYMLTTESAESNYSHVDSDTLMVRFTGNSSVFVSGDMYLATVETL